jgi:DMSO reductase anchor subunit
MLTFTQIGVGLLTGYAILSFLSGSAALGVGIAGTGALLLGLGASVLHLGQPLKAWRVFLGLRKSWLSREVVTFGGVPPLAMGALVFPQFLAVPAVLAGLAGVFTSVMVYADTQRVLWRFPRTALRFFGTTALFAAGGLSFGDNAVRWPALAAVIAVLAIKLAWEILFLRHAHADDDAPDTLSARILTGDAGGMRRKGIARFLLAGLGLAMVFTGFVPVMVVGLACLAAGEWIERYQFFRSVVAHRMPGGM